MRNPLRYSPLAAVIFLIGSTSSQSSYAQTKPTVVSTDPANGATGVNPDLRSFSVTFSKTMNTANCGATTYNWLGAGGVGNTCVWSGGNKVMTVTRATNSPSLPLGSTVTVVVNPVGFAYIKDTEGNLLDTYTFSFSAYTPGSFDKIPANPAKGFSWPYYLRVPVTVKQPAFLLVEPNNTGTVNDDQTVHDQAAKNEAIGWATNVEDIECPYLIPTFPRPASHPEIYTHALDRNTILTKVAGLERIDLQLLAMIDDARERLAAKGINVDRKVFMFGASASGQFASRFVMLHPDRIKAASIGAPGYGPIVPVSQWKGQTLNYHIGVADLQQLVGQKFDAAAFSQVPLQLWVGDMDTNIVPWYRPSTDAEVAQVEQVFGSSGAEEFWRWANYEAAYSAADSAAQFVVIPGMGHQWADWSFMKEFFERNRATPAPAPLPRPYLYTLYFPHVACGSSWNTEIAITNTSSGAPARGTLRTYSAEGGPPLESVSITIPPAGRKEIAVCSFFAQPQAAAYMSFLSDTGFIAGYTRFSQPGMRASLPATTGTRQGWFLKMEQGSDWTGIALVNVSSQPANVTLTALDENGIEVGQETLQLPAGKKSLGLVTQVFKSDVRSAKYFKYDSDRQLLGFTVSGSADGLQLDGLAAMPQFSRYLERQQ